MQRTTTLAAAAALLALAAPAAAQQVVNDNGTDANGPITIFKNYVAEPRPVRVVIDGQEVDDLTQISYADITAGVHRGPNTMTVVWNGPVQQLHVKVAFAPSRNAFKNVAEINANAQRDPSLRAAGSKTISFTIPG